MPKILDPTLDVVFKLMFTQPGCEDMLISLLTAVLRPPSAITSVVILNPDLEKQTVGDKGVVLDLRVRLASGAQANVEMQADGRAGMRKRALYHWARLYSAQLVRSMQYAELRPCVSVFLLGYRELRSSRFHSTFRVIEVHDHAVLDDTFELHLVELPKLPEALSLQAREEGGLVGWGRFFVATDQHERKELAMSDPILAKANEVLERLSADPEIQRLAQEREEAFLLYQMELNTAREEAEAKGLERGLEQGLEGQRALLNKLLERRFGELPDAARARVAAASSEELMRWADGLLGADSLDALLG